MYNELLSYKVSLPTGIRQRQNYPTIASIILLQPVSEAVLTASGENRGQKDKKAIEQKRKIEREDL